VPIISSEFLEKKHASGFQSSSGGNSKYQLIEKTLCICYMRYSILNKTFFSDFWIHGLRSPIVIYIVIHI
jgi:hypothetical protein